MKTTDKSNSRREEKKQVNIKWNSRLFFQIGIILSLLLVFILMETSFNTKESKIYADTGFYLEEPTMKDYIIDIDRPDPVVVPKQPIVKPRPEPRLPKVVNPTTIEIIDNYSSTVESDVLTNDLPDHVDQRIESPIVDPIPEPATPRSIINVEHVPVYPGCETLGSNAEKIECMSAKINSYINRNFRKELLENLEQNQVHKIYVQFKIDSKGFITDVRANSTNERLKKEAQRVVGNLPEMKPGKQGNKNVDVLYTVPIIFKIQ